jgi:hypothetical protein
MKPPNERRRPRQAAPEQNHVAITRRTKSTAGVSEWWGGPGPTAEYIESRERVLGSFRIHLDPDIAADMLLDALGGRRGARRWLDDLGEALDRLGGAA